MNAVPSSPGVCGDAKRMECVRLAGAVCTGWTFESGSKLAALHTLRGFAAPVPLRRAVRPMVLCQRESKSRSFRSLNE